MFVELLGLPASGKSTVLTGLARHYKRAGLRFRSIGKIDDKDAKIPGYIRRNAVPRAIYRLEQFRTRYPDCLALIDDICAAQTATKSLLFGTAVDFQTYQANRAATDFATTDEGFLHRAIYSLTKHGDAANVLRQYCNAIPVPDVVIYLNLPAADSFERAVARLSARDKSGSSDSKIRARITKAHGSAETLKTREALMNQATDQMAQRGACIIQLNTLDPAAQVQADAIAALDALRNAD